MATATHNSTTTTASRGYKGHRKGTKKERAHQFFDENRKLPRQDVLARIVKLGAKPSTAASWYQDFKQGKKPGGRKAGKKQVVSKTKAAKVRRTKPAAKPATSSTTTSAKETA